MRPREIKPEETNNDVEFDSTREYIDYLREEIEEKNKSIKDTQNALNNANKHSSYWNNEWNKSEEKRRALKDKLENKSDKLGVSLIVNVFLLIVLAVFVTTQGH